MGLHEPKNEYWALQINSITMNFKCFKHFIIFGA